VPAKASDSPGSGGSGGDSTVLVVILVIVIVVVCCVVVGVALFLWRRRQRGQHKSFSADSHRNSSSDDAPGDEGLYSAFYSGGSSANDGGDPSHYSSISPSRSPRPDDSSDDGGGVYGAVPSAALELGIIASPAPKVALKDSRSSSSSLNSRRQALGAKWNIEPADLLWGPELGRGAYGVVYDGMWRKNTRVAIKVMTQMTETALAELQAEASLMERLRPHPNVLQLQGVCHEPYSLVTEYASNGSLDDWMKKNTATPKQLFNFCHGVARGVLHLHAEGIIHRDLAARNILLMDSLEPKVADFGQSRIDTGSGQNQTKTETGPLKWMAPEAIMDHVYSPKTDSWAYAVTTVEIYTGELPYPDKAGMAVATKVAMGQMEFSPPPAMHPVVAKIYLRCMEFEPSDRPEFGEICDMFDGCSEFDSSASEKSASDTDTGSAASSGKPSSSDSHADSGSGSEDSSSTTMSSSSELSESSGLGSGSSDSDSDSDSSDHNSSSSK
jgi:serine/threonine protein kinase